MRRISLILVAAALVLAGTAGAAGKGQVSLVAYSTPTVAFGKLISAFQQTPAGKDVSFTQSYGGSEVQAKAIVAGLPADVVDLSHEGDMNTLVGAGLVAKSWNANAYQGFVSRSVVVFVVRNGNPKHIRSWDDLVKSGVEVVA